MLINRVVKITFLISFVGHFVFLSAPVFNLNLFQTKKHDEITVRIETEKQSFHNIGEEKKIKEVVEEEPKLEQKQIFEPKQEEVVMEQSSKEQVEEQVKVVNPSKVSMIRYQDMIRQKIEETKRYPLFARRQGIEGTVGIKFVILANGSIQDIRIVRSSGSKILDDSAVETIKRANPFPSIPEEINVSFVQIELSIVFTLQK